jgi:hypothetical protein
MENQDQALAVQPKPVTGYQWGDCGRFIGPYTFESIGDKVHLPPRTTLQAPPENLAVDQEAAWDAERSRWIPRRIAMAHLPDREVPNVD